MTQLIHAVYEAGVFRPLEPVNLAEQEQVVLVVSASSEQSTASDDSPAATSSELQQQRDALIKMRAQMDAIPITSPQDDLGGADHDAILYGRQT